MLDANEKRRFNRHIILEGFGHESQIKLKESKVLVIGAGGLGCPVLLYLSAAGVGRIGVVEYDTVDESNLQRQVIYKESDIGKSKIDCAVREIRDRNQSIIIDKFPFAINTENAFSIIREYDVVIDTTDNFSTRYLVNDVCLHENKPLVYGAIFKFEGQVSVFNYKDGPSYRCVFPEPPSAEEAPNCSEIGVIGVLPGIIGTMQATEAIKLITGIGEVLNGMLLTYNALNQRTTKFKVVPNKLEKENVLNKKSFSVSDYDFNCQIDQKYNEIIPDDFLSFYNRKEPILIDLRESNEYPKLKNLPYLSITLSDLETEIKSLDETQTYLVFCQSGIRSSYASNLLIENNFKNIYNLKGGINSLVPINDTIF